MANDFFFSILMYSVLFLIFNKSINYTIYYLLVYLLLFSHGVNFLNFILYNFYYNVTK